MERYCGDCQFYEGTSLLFGKCCWLRTKLTEGPVWFPQQAEPVVGKFDHLNSCREFLVKEGT